MASTACLVAVHDVEDAGRPARLDEQLGQPHRHARVLLGRLEDEAVADGDGDPEHPHRDHGREVERRDAGHDAEGLTHGIDVDARTGAFGVFALERMRDAAGELDHLEPALDVAAGVGEHLAVLGGEQRGELVHARLDQPLELEHHPRAPLRVDRRPAGLRGHGRLDRLVHHACIGEDDPRLHLAGVGVEHVAGAPGARDCRAVDEVGDLTHASNSLALKEDVLEQTQKEGRPCQLLPLGEVRLSALAMGCHGGA